MGHLEPGVLRADREIRQERPVGAAARGVALERLRDLTGAKRASVTTFGGEEWTPRKVMRRMLEHEREHIHEIRELLAAKHPTTWVTFEKGLCSEAEAMAQFFADGRTVDLDALRAMMVRVLCRLAL